MMKRIVRERSSGKTRELIAEAAATPNSAIVCAEHEVPRMVRKIHDYGYVGIPVVSYQVMLASTDEQINYFIDDLDDFASEIGVKGYTLSVD